MKRGVEVQYVAGNDKERARGKKRQNSANENAISHGSGLKAGRRILDPLVMQPEYQSGK